MPLPPDGGTKDQLYEEAKTKQQWKLIVKSERSERSEVLGNKIDPTDSQDSTNLSLLKDSKVKSKGGEGLDIEMNQAEQ